MRTVVGVLRGGPSIEYEVSLKSGSGVLQHLDKEKYEPRDIFIDRTGQWHNHGIPSNPEKALTGIDIAFNALHGEYGSGRVQQILSMLKIPFTGSGALGAAQARQRTLGRKAAVRAGIKVPYATTIELEGNLQRAAQRLFRTFPLPLRITVGEDTLLAQDYYGVERALAAVPSPNILVEEYIPGREAQVGVIEDFRGEKTYVLIPLPGDFSPAQKSDLVQAAKAMHEELNLTHYSLLRFTVTKRGVYFAGADALPELHDAAAMRSGLAAVGAPMPHFLDHVIQLARNV